MRKLPQKGCVFLSLIKINTRKRTGRFDTAINSEKKVINVTGKEAFDHNGKLESIWMRAKHGLGGKLCNTA